MAMRNRIARTISPETTRTSVENCMVRLAFQNLFPTAHVGDAALVAGYDHFGAARNFDGVLASRGNGLTGAVADIQDFTHAMRADGTAHAPQNSDHLVIGRIHGALAGGKLVEEPQHDAGSAETAGRGDEQAEISPNVGVALQQIAGAAEPGQKGGDGGEIEPG